MNIKEAVDEIVVWPKTFILVNQNGVNLSNGKTTISKFLHLKLYPERTSVVG